ncbi:hypothetical protein FDZ71_02510 [bacterium]|nr:MAG: hypothetical protein FDZ71_02510 [bacterium]
MKKVLAITLALLAPALALACFGAELRIGVGKERADAFASYALGFFIEEKTGIEPLFVETDDSKTFAENKIDLRILPATSATPAGAFKQQPLKTPGGEAAIWLTSEVKDDIRFTTLERALKIAGGFFSSKALNEAASQSGEPKKAARKAVLDAQ